MANLNKYKASECVGLLKHNNRTDKEETEHSNENIDTDRTFLNYHLKKGSYKEMQKRLDEVYKANNNENTIAMCEWVVTMPNDVDENDERAFFEAVYDYFAEDLGEENIINAVIHKDEITPHLHLDFVPVIIDDRDYTGHKGHAQIYKYQMWKAEHGGEPVERLCAKSLVSREYLQNAHAKMSEFVAERLGYTVSILNGATINGNKKVAELKYESLVKEIDRLENIKKTAVKEVQSLFAIAKNNNLSSEDLGYIPLLQKIDDLKTTNDVLKSIIVRNQYRYTDADLDKIKEHRYTPSQNASVSIFDGTFYQDIVKDDKLSISNALIVCNVPDDMDKINPNSTLAKLMKIDSQILRNINLVKSATTDVVIKVLKGFENVALMFLKNKPSVKEMSKTLLEEFSTKLRSIKKEGLGQFGKMNDKVIYMEKPMNDQYNLALQILQENEMKCRYYTCREEYEKLHEQEEKEKSENMNKEG